MSYSYRIEQAIRAATILHKDQMRKGSVPMPYVGHLFAVALIVSDYTDSEDTLIAALLHDTLEDTDYTAKELQEDFGGTVRDIIEPLSEPPDTETETASWKDKKKHYAKQLKDAPLESLLIAAADKIHNMRSIIEEYYDDHTRFLKEFEGTLEDRVQMYQEISNILNRRLSNDIMQEFNHVFDEYRQFISTVKQTRDAR